MSTLVERIAALCTCRVHDYGICCGGSDFRCACCIDCRKNKPKATCKQECHAIAGEVDLLQKEADQSQDFIRKAMRAGIQEESRQVAALAAKVESGHDGHCACHEDHGSVECEQAVIDYGDHRHQHPFVDPRCTEWRNRRG